MLPQHYSLIQLGSGVCFLLGPWLALPQPSYTGSQCIEPNTFLVNPRVSVQRMCFPSGCTHEQCHKVTVVPHSCQHLVLSVCKFLFSKSFWCLCGIISQWFSFLLLKWPMKLSISSYVFDHWLSFLFCVQSFAHFTAEEVLLFYYH